MAKVHKKTGKGRLDKYYKLAKEQGYRARSAFKLIQLNKKYSILEQSRCTIDLCAAPGGWLQVASKCMPINSIIIGVDLVPIKPIPRVVTFTADITTPQCRNLIRNELKDWKADVVLHDGAPNVGTAWIQDAYSQSELVLMSLKLAVEFLAKGGIFVTKVFRSVDYNNLIWVFNQLFGKVEATKPPSSRNVSAEIFVVCREYLAPKYIDPKFLDPKHVFKELSAEAKGNVNADKAQANVFHPEKKRRHREGYADGDYTLFKTLSASSFIYGNDPVFALGGTNQMTFLTEEEKKWLSFDLTTEDVKANCDDLKVLGKGDFKTLIKWRVALREELGIDVKTKNTEDATEHAEVVDVDEEQEISAELERLNTEAAARAKRDRRKANEIRNKTIQRMQLQMTAPMDIGLEQQDLSLRTGQEDVFDLDIQDRDLRRTLKKTLVVCDEGRDAVISSEDEGEDEDSDEVMSQSADENETGLAELAAELDDMYKAYQGRLRERDAKSKVRAARNLKMDDWHGIRRRDSDLDSYEEDDTKNGGWEGMQKAKLQDGETDDSISESEEESKPRTQKRTRFEEETISKHKRSRLSPDVSDVKTNTTAAASLWFSRDVFGNLRGLDQLNSEDEVDASESIDSREDHASIPNAKYSDEDPAGEDFELVAQDQDDELDVWDEGREDQQNQKRIKNFSLTTPEAMTLAQQLVNRAKTKTQFINDGFNRYSLNSKDGLPSWFLDDEGNHYKPNISVTKEAIAALRAKQRALDARPIKKVAEAKARKKFKAAQRLEKARKKAEGVNTTANMSEREKAQAIDKLMRKGLSKGSRKKDIKVVVAKGMHRGVKGRPKGVKGRYLMVDSRMKKEMRAKKRMERATKTRR